MAITLTIKAEPRTAVGRNAVKSVRKKGYVPGVVYGKKSHTIIQIPRVALQQSLKGTSSETVLVDLEIGKEKKLAVLQDIQHHPIKDFIVHIDLHEVDPDETLHVEVPVHEVGESIGVKNFGGILETVTRRLKIACKPRDLPDHITVDISNLNIGQSIHVSQIQPPPGVTILNPPDQPVFACVAAAAAEETQTPESAATTEPEVIKEKKPTEGESATVTSKEKDKKSS
ncbi:MAG: 50S ribosomal protein L25 [Methylacidiphilales bacterium]|nr:50S ribosomal protein L25 [Candidatus Methylacidiphilales bacterium]MDW8349634.1 50S ribosomal protein L25 [Verrucomicrobiae bacterium]